MHDSELLERLRDLGGLWAHLAAARIEALTAERDRQYNENVHRIAMQAKAEADNARLRAALAVAADLLDWADAHLETLGAVSTDVRYGAREARAALTAGKETK
jgi:hypothetical protein